MISGDLDAAYDNRSAVADSARFMASWRERSARRRAAPDARLDLRYGPAPRALIDLFPTRTPGAPLLAFFHGGYWQWNAKEDFAFVADGLVELSLNVAVVGYTLAPEATLDEIVAEARAAVAWLAAHRAELGLADADLLVGGWSAGGHLAAMAAHDPRVRAGFALSGIFDLEPLLRTSLNAQLRLDAAAARRASPLHAPLARVPFDIAVGADELPELRRQSAAFAAARTAAGLPGRFTEYPNLHHYTILNDLPNVVSRLSKA